MGLRLQLAERADRAFNIRKKTTSGAALTIRRNRGFHAPDRLMSSRFRSTYRYRATAFPHEPIEFNNGLEPSLERERTARAAAYVIVPPDCLHKTVIVPSFAGRPSTVAGALPAVMTTAVSC